MLLAFCVALSAGKDLISGSIYSNLSFQNFALLQLTFLSYFAQRKIAVKNG